MCGHSLVCIFSLRLLKYLILRTRFGIYQYNLQDSTAAMSVNVLSSSLRQHETVTPGELPLIQEVTTTLREWSTIWRQLYVVRKRDVEPKLKNRECSFWTLLYRWDFFSFPWEPQKQNFWELSHAQGEESPLFWPPWGAVCPLGPALRWAVAMLTVTKHRYREGPRISACWCRTGNWLLEHFGRQE